MISISNLGKNNHISLDPAYELCGFALVIEGDDNEVIFAKPSAVLESNLVSIVLLGNNNVLNAGAIYSNSLTIHAVSGLRCVIGDRTSFNKVFMSSNEPSSIVIGEDCLFANDIRIYPTDFHKIFAAGERINNPEPVKIGNKVWVCESAIIRGGAIIENGSIVGAGALVSGLVPSRSIAVGNPAKVVRSDVEWLP